MTKSTATVLEAAGREVVITNPDKVFFPQAGYTKLDLVRYYAGGRRGRAARDRGAADRAQALRRRRRRGALLPEARARAAPRVDRDGGAALSLRPDRARDRRARRGAAPVDREPRLHRPQPASGARRRSRASRRAARRPRPRPGRELGRRATGGAASCATCSTSTACAAGRRPRARAASTSTCASSGAGASTRCGARRWRSRARWSGARPRIATSKWWKEERHGVFLDYNQNAKDRTVASAWSVRPTPDARVSMPLEWDEVAELRSGGLHAGHARRRASRERGDAAAGIDDAAGSLEPTARAVRRAGGGGPRRRALAAALQEAARRAAARRAVATRRAQAAVDRQPLITVAKAEHKEDALAGLERWKARHPAAAALLQVDDVLVDSMRGRSSTWTRIRVNLRHVPEAERPAEEAPDPDYDPWRGPAPAGARVARAEDALQLVGGRDLQLIVAAVLAAACRGASARTARRDGSESPACGRTRPRTRARAAAAPSSGPCRGSSGWSRRAAAGPSRLASSCASAQSRQGWSSSAFSRSGASSSTSCLRTAFVNAAVTPTWCSVPVVVVEAEQERADHRARPVLVPAEAGDDAVGRARVLDLDHRALAGAVRRVETLGHHAVETGALEAAEPVLGERAIARRGREVDRRRRARRAPARAAAAAARAAPRAGPRRPARAGPRRRTRPASRAASSFTRDAAGWMRSSSASKSRPPAPR